MKKGGIRLRKNQLLLETLVYKVLNKYPKTRDDDFELVLKTYSTLCPSILEKNFGSILKEHKEYDLPSFESITRARRKVQAQYNELASQKTLIKRQELEEEYRNYHSGYYEG